jgi:tRNA U34 5-methylaminomethyl-2-thiouridine-forming methyltransferase MnmC
MKVELDLDYALEEVPPEPGDLERNRATFEEISQVRDALLGVADLLSPNG